MADQKPIISHHLETLKVVYRSIDDLKPNEYNPNRQNEEEFELLCRSMEEDGFTQPIVAIPDGTIVDGEHRWRAARHLGIKEIPVCFVKMTKAQARIATLRHNRARGAEDFGLTADVMRDLQRLGAIDWAQHSLGMTDDEINLMLEEGEQSVVEAIGGAAEEFTEAWEPTIHSQSSIYDDGRERSVVLASERTAQAVEAQQRKLSAATDPDERRRIIKSVSFFRVSFRFRDDDAVLVQKVMEDLCPQGVEMGDHFVKVCRRYLAWKDAQEAA